MMNRRDYLVDVLNVKQEKEKAYLDVMDKYSFDWWTSSNPAEVVKYQLKEPVLLVLVSKLQNALEDVLKRPVRPEEISFRNQALKEEAFAAIAAMA